MPEFSAGSPSIISSMFLHPSVHLHVYISSPALSSTIESSVAVCPRRRRPGSLHAYTMHCGPAHDGRLQWFESGVVRDPLREHDRTGTPARTRMLVTGIKNAEISS